MVGRFKSHHNITFRLKMQQKHRCATPGDCKHEDGVLSLTINLTDRVTTEYFRRDFNLESKTFPCSVWGETAFSTGNTMSNPFIKICPQKHPGPVQLRELRSLLPSALLLSKSHNVLLYFISMTWVHIHQSGQSCSNTLWAALQHAISSTAPVRQIQREQPHTRAEAE